MEWSVAIARAVAIVQAVAIAHSAEMPLPTHFTSDTGSISISLDVLVAHVKDNIAILDGRSLVGPPKDIAHWTVSFGACSVIGSQKCVGKILTRMTIKIFSCPFSAAFEP
jgi:hypothetical protein